MLTDSASAIKYWYFMRVMGREASHLTLECGLQTHVNYVVVGEEAAQRSETLMDVVNKIVDLVIERANKGKNFGCVLIPEGLLTHTGVSKNLIMELDQLFCSCKNK